MFASDFHSYDVDEGNINYDEYIRHRATLVSIPKKGWTVADQVSDLREF